MTIRHNDLLGRSACVVLLLVWTWFNIESVRLHTSTLLLRCFLGFSSWIQMKLSEQRESFCKREKKSAKYSTRQKFWAATFTTSEGVREILITLIKLILFSVKTVWSGFILIIAQDFRADLLYRGNFNPGITWIEAARSRHVYRKIGSSAHKQYVYPLSSCWSGSPAPTWLHSKFPARLTGIPASQSQGPSCRAGLAKQTKPAHAISSLYYCFSSDYEVLWTPQRQWNQKNSEDAVRRLGTIIQSIFCAQSGASIRLAVWKWSGESRYPGALPPVLENFRRAFYPGGPTDCP